MTQEAADLNRYDPSVLSLAQSLVVTKAPARQVANELMAAYASGYRAGQQAMREACASVAESFTRFGHAPNHADAPKLAARRIRALPIEDPPR